MDANASQDMLLKVSDLDKYGISSNTVVVQYQKQNKRQINLDELVKVSPHEESQSIKLETFDQISITVPVFSAAGTWNKIE